jgi:hypothetical protein
MIEKEFKISKHWMEYRDELDQVQLEGTLLETRQRRLAPANLVNTMIAGAE